MNEENYLNEKKKVQMSFVDVFVFPVIFVLTTFLISAVLDLFWSVKSRGLSTAIIYLCFFTVATIYIVTKRKTFCKEAILPGALALFTAVSYIIHGDFYYFIFTFLMLIYLSGSYCVKMVGEAKDTYGSYFYLLEVWRSEVAIPTKNAFLPLRSLKTLAKAPDGERKKISSKTLGIIGGALLSIPVIAVVVPLLIDGDAAFGSLATTAVDKIGEFLCEYAKNDCRRCPVIWNNESYDYMCEIGYDDSCEDLYDDLYDVKHNSEWANFLMLMKQKDYDTAAKIAREIANLPESIE